MINKKYQEIRELGKGSYGKVFLAKDEEGIAKYALKEINLKLDEGIPYSAIREIILLKELQHPNILRLLDVLHGKNTITLVLDYIETDLKKMINQSNSGLSPSKIKNYLYQILKGVEYMHRKKILHRDLKPENILMTKDEIAKIADFGLGRSFGIPINGYSSAYVTLTYRAPELLLGSQSYGPSVDMWSVGCIFAEMSRGQILFIARNNEDQLDKIFRIRGTPNEEKYPDLKLLQLYGESRIKYKNYPEDDIQKYVPKLDCNGVDLLDKMLQINPDNRISAKEALKHPYFDDIDDTYFNGLYNDSKKDNY